jgi:tetratricopeptide (TPR) repeat protein
MRRILIVLALMLVAAPAWAQTRLDYDMCNAKLDPDANISGCGALIEKGETDYAIYDLRALAYFSKGLYAQAIADFTKVIALDSKNHSYYSLRGFAYEKNGQREQAIADYRLALKLNPRDSSPAKAAQARLKVLGAAP